MAQQTAVQQLIEWAVSLKNNSQQCTDWICIKEKAEELLQMEKEQIKKAWFDSTLQFDNAASMVDKKEFEQYYNETYGNH